jgi:hypothetical protein
MLVVGWLGVCVWSWLKPALPDAQDDDPERDRQIAVIVGLLGGTIETAAHARYAISRLEEDLGRKATLHEIATAMGVTLGSDV